MLSFRKKDNMNAENWPQLRIHKSQQTRKLPKDQSQTIKNLHLEIKIKIRTLLLNIKDVSKQTKTIINDFSYLIIIFIF